MRVISGSARGLKLSTIDSMDTRPTLDRVKEAIFSILIPYIPTESCLDLFAGSGGLGIEALSRGVESAVFVDANPECIRVIEQNVERARLKERSSIIRSDFASYLLSCKRGFDIIFLDPPYKMDRLNEILTLISDNSILNKSGIILIEADNGTKVEHPSFNVIKEKKYGRVNVFVLESKDTI